MNLEHDVFFNGVAKASQGSPFHVVDYTNVYNGEIGVGNGDGVILFKVGYSELVDKYLGEDRKKLLQVEKQACNEKLFVGIRAQPNFLSHLEYNKYMGILLS